MAGWFAALSKTRNALRRAFAGPAADEVPLDLDEVEEHHPDAGLAALKNKLAVALKTGHLKVS